MKPSLSQRFKLLKQAARVQRLTRDAENLLEEVRTTEGATCGYCGAFNTWKTLTDESTQERQEPLICHKCVKRRKMAHELGWLDWPKQH
jgi:superfamily II helicase